MPGGTDPALRRPRASSTACAATVACPTNGASLRALKKRSANVVIRAASAARHEGDLGMRELARDGRQGGIALSVRIEHDGRRIAGEAGRA